MKKLLRVVILVVFSALWPAVILALNLPSLYTVEIPIASQSEDIKEQAIKDGFAQILLKVSGDPDILGNPIIKDNVGRADYYVQEYSYSQPSTNSSVYTIQIRYDADDVKRLLKRAGQQYWGDNRPLLLVWLSLTDKNNENQIIDSGSGNNTYHRMVGLGKKVGLPLIFPIMDMTDMNQVSSDDVNTMSLPALEAAAKRYAPDGLLIGNIKMNGMDYDGDWLLIVGKNQWKWSLTDPTLDGMTSAIIDFVSQTLARHYVLNSATNNKSMVISVHVSNVAKGDDLSQLLQSIKQISSVQKVDLGQISGEEVDLTVQVRGNIDSFQQNATIDHRLMLKSQDSTNNKLYYEWTHS